MRKNHAALPLFKALTDLTRAVGKGLQEFTSNPHAPAPEGIAEIAAVCATMGLASYRQFFLDCGKLANNLRAQPRADGFRELAIALNAVGTHLKETSEGARPSFKKLNSMYRRLNDHLVSIDLAQALPGGGGFAMFRTLEADSGWRPSPSASEEAVRGYIRSHLSDLESLDTGNLMRFFQALESRNNHPSVKVWIDATICLLNSGNVSPDAAAALGGNLVNLLDHGYSGLSVGLVGVLLSEVSVLSGGGARLNALRELVLSDSGGLEIDVELLRQFVGAIDQFKEIVRQGAATKSFAATHDAATKISKHTGRLNLNVLTSLIAAAASSTAPGAQDGADEGRIEETWIYLAMATTIMQQSLELASRGFDESTVHPIAHEIERRLADPSIPFGEPMPDSGRLSATTLRAALANFTKEASITLDVARKGLESAVTALDRGLSQDEVIPTISGPVREAIACVGSSLKSLGATRTSALAQMAVAACSPAQGEVLDVRLLTNACGVLLLGLERMGSGSTHLIDELVSHEIEQIAPDLAAPAHADADAFTPGADENETNGEDPVSIFVEEMMSYAQAAQDKLAACSDQSMVPSALNDVLRLFHTVAGSSTVASLGSLSTTARSIEHLVDDWIEHEIDDANVAMRLVGQSASGVDLLVKVLTGLKTQGARQEDLASMAAFFATEKQPVATQALTIEFAGIAPTESPLTSPAANEQSESDFGEQPWGDMIETPAASVPAEEIEDGGPAHSGAEGADRTGEDLLELDHVEPAGQSVAVAQSENDEAPLAGAEEPAAQQAPSANEHDDDGIEASTVGFEMLGLRGSGLDGQAIDVSALAATIAQLASEATDDLGKLSDQSLVTVLSDEAMSLIPQLRDLAGAWVLGQATEEHLGDIRRVTHTLKGCVRVGGMMKVGATLHALEEALDGIEGQESTILGRQDIAALFSRHLDACGTTIESFLYGTMSGQVALHEPEVRNDTAEAEEGFDVGGQVTALGYADSGQSQDSSRAAHDSQGHQDSLPAPEHTSVDHESGQSAPEFTPQSVNSLDAAQGDGDKLSDASRKPLPAAASAGAAAAGPSIRVAVGSARSISEEAGRTTALQERGVAQLADAQQAALEMGKHLARANQLINALQVEADIRIQSSRSDHGAGSFDPIELDRYNRLQEVTRALAECIADVSMCGGDVQSHLQRLSLTDSELSSLANSLQERAIGLLEVPFDSLAGRLRHVVTLACKDAGKQARITVQGEANIPGPVLDKLTPCIEHILRNAVAHGIEPPQVRTAAGKSAEGLITLSASRRGAKVVLTITDDGGGIDRMRVIEKAKSKGMIAVNAAPSEIEVNALLFRPGFSTADSVSQLAGRGVGLDVVASSLNEIGGDVHLTSISGNGTSFVLSAPTDISSMSVLPVTCEGREYLIPAALVDQVVPLRLKVGEAPPAAIKVTSTDGRNQVMECPVVRLTRFVGHGERSACSSKPSLLTSLIVMGADSGAPQAFQVDEVSAQRKINTTKLSSLVTHLPGLLATNIDVDHNVVLVINPTRMADLGTSDTGAEGKRKLIMLVDDSATVRLSTSTGLRKAGFDVLTAVDGLDAVEQLKAGAMPDIFVFDLEMPRMDGFELTAYVRGRPEFSDTKILVVSSRTMQKHRDRVMSLGASSFLGKPAHAQDLVGMISSTEADHPAPVSQN